MTPGLAPSAYQSAARSTAVYPRIGRNLAYPTLGLAGESAEVLDKIAAGSDVDGVLAELGDVLWYVASLSAEAGVSLVNVCGRDRFPVGVSADLATAGVSLSCAVGAVCETVKKAERDDSGVLTAERRARLIDQLATVLQACSVIAATCGLTLEDAAGRNAAKLSSRAQRGALHGSGDNR